MEDTESPERTSGFSPVPRPIDLFEGDLAGGERTSEVESARRSSTNFGLSSDLAGEAPILRFASGAPGRSLERALMRAWNGRDYGAAQALLEERERELSRFQRSAMRWLFAILEGDTVGGERHRARAESLAVTPIENAALAEDMAFARIRAGRFTEARDGCERALSLYPTNEGLWVNLLLSLSRLDEGAAVEAILSRLPRLLDLERGLVGLYITHDPTFRAAVCNGG